MYLLTIAQQIEFGIKLSFEQYQNCNVLFKSIKEN